MAPRAPDIDRADLQHEVSVATLLVNVDVVDAHDFASVNVDDLLVEQVALQQEQAFAAAVRAPLGRVGGYAQLACRSG